MSYFDKSSSLGGGSSRSGTELGKFGLLAHTLSCIANKRFGLG